jgi:hypothetical protein
LHIHFSDFLKLQDGCKKKLLEGSTLTVSMVPVTSSLLISGFNPEIPEETIQYYFENKRRSGQVWLISVQRFQRRRFKCEKLTDGRTDDGCLPMTKAHMAYGQVS